MSEVIIIAAISKNFVIGNGMNIPWHIPEDFKRFKSLTLNNPCIMGRRTFESLPIKPLPLRENIVLSSRNYFVFDGVKVFSDFKEAIDYAKLKSEKVFIIGGAKVYELGLEFADVLELTILEKEVVGDVFFPKFDETKFVEISREEKFDEKEGKYFFVRFEKKK